jgi:hypothetical protein
MIVAYKRDEYRDKSSLSVPLQLLVVLMHLNRGYVTQRLMFCASCSSVSAGHEV